MHDMTQHRYVPLAAAASPSITLSPAHYNYVHRAHIFHNHRRRSQSSLVLVLCHNSKTAHRRDSKYPFSHISTKQYY